MNERRSSQDQAMNRISVSACCGMPDLLQDFVSFPEPLLVEQIDSFSQNFVLPSCRNSGFKGSERYDLGDLAFDKILGSAEIGWCREEVEFDSGRAHPEVSDLLVRLQYFSYLCFQHPHVLRRVGLVVVK